MTKRARALTAGSIATGLLVILLGISYVRCTKVHTPRVAGRVVDARSGEAVEGADVMVYRTVDHAISHSRLHFDYRWTTTGPNGSFSFEPSTVWKPEGTWWWRLEEEPSLNLIHPQYGSPPTFVPDDPAKWGNFELAIEPSQRTLDALQDRFRSVVICGGLNGRGYRHCCKVAYGGADQCE